MLAEMDPSDLEAARLVQILSDINSSSSLPPDVYTSLGYSFYKHVRAFLNNVEMQEGEDAKKFVKTNYLPFIQNCLELLPECMRNSKSYELILAYDCCLLTMSSLSSIMIFKKPYNICLERKKFLVLLKQYNWHHDAVRIAMRILSSIPKLDLDRCTSSTDIQVVVELVEYSVHSFLTSWKKKHKRELNLEDKIFYKDFDEVMGYWVQSLCKVSHMGTQNQLPTWHMFLDFFTAKFPILQVLEKEILKYESTELENPIPSAKLQLAIIKILQNSTYVRDLTYVQRFRLLLRKGRLLRFQSRENTSKSINSLTKAIRIGVTKHFEKEDALVHHEFAVAYGLRAIANQEKHPETNHASKDIEAALKLWMTISDDSGSVLRKSSICIDPLHLLCCLIDILTLKSCTKFDSSIFQMMIKLGNWRAVSINECMKFLWGSRRLGHALCISPISERFISDASNAKFTTTKFWMDCLKDSKPLLFGFKQKFLYETFDHITVDCLKKVCYDLTSKDSRTIQSTFLAGQIYYDLCERLVASGQLHKAIACGNEALKLRSRMYQLYFSTASKSQDKKLKNPTCTLKDSAGNEMWSLVHPSESMDNYHLSPWKVIQCYLESHLQIGIVWEMVGNDKEAKKCLWKGKAVADQMKLSLFRVSFSCVLGKLYNGQQFLQLSDEELASAEKILKQGNFEESCKKCKLMLEVSVNLERCELINNFSASQNKDVSLQSYNAEALYTSALQKLESRQWKDTFSFPYQSSKSCICSGKNCYICTSIHVKNSKSLKDLINLKYESSRRRSYVSLLHGKVMCQGIQDNNEMQQDILRKSFNVLFRGNAFKTDKFDLLQSTAMLSKMIMEFLGSKFAIQIATVLYNLSWSYFKREANVIRSTGRELKLLMDTITWLKHAFILGREVPNLFIKVSRLLSVVYILGPWKELSCLPTEIDNLSESHLAAYFHASSVGTHSSRFFSSSMQEKFSDAIDDEEDSSRTSSTSKELEPFNQQRVDEECKQFFDNQLPCMTICLSMIGQPLAKWLKDILEYDTTIPIHAWLLVSRLKHGNEPLVALLPVHSKLEKSTTAHDVCCESKKWQGSSKWKAKWGLTPIDEIAPLYKHILMDDSIARVAILHETQPEFKMQTRTAIDGLLAEFLRKLEEEWFGPWVSLLCAELSNPHQGLEEEESKLITALKSDCNITVNAVVLRALLSARSELKAEEVIEQLSSWKKGCIIGKRRYKASDADTISQTQRAIELMGKALQKVQKHRETNMRREPIILVPDLEVQMLPWESIPTLKREEVYRVPTISSIRWILDNKSLCHEDLPMADCVRSPLIDPLEVICLENEQFNDCVKVYFDRWARDNESIQRIYGDKEMPKDLSYAVKDKELFVYFGHGNYVKKINWEELDTWPACMLLGCETGTLFYTGSYGPSGNPLELLHARSPVVLSTLWVLLVSDMQIYSEGAIHALLQERHLIEKRLISEEGSSISDSRPTFASFMNEGREACKQQYCTGAAFVCYGVPTGVWSKSNKESTESKRSRTS